MKNKQILQPDLLDIIFEHRNKAYGAYALRKNYNHRLLKALITAFMLAGLFFFLTSLKSRNTNRNHFDKNDGVVLTEVHLDEQKPKEKEPEPKPKPEKQPEVKQKDFQTIKVVPDNLADKPIASLDELANAVIGDKDVDGPAYDGTVRKNETGDGKDNAAPEKQPEKTPEVTGPSFLPSFPGGMNGLSEFLRRNLRTPDNLDPGTKITILVKFMVNEDGTISDYKIVQSGGRELDGEVIRVVKKMPAWNPGKQNGRPVSMYFTQPVTFIGEEG